MKNFKHEHYFSTTNEYDSLPLYPFKILMDAYYD